MDFKILFANIERAKSPSVFYNAVKKIIDESTEFLDDNNYYDNENRQNGISVSVKLGNMDSFEDVLDKFVDDNELCEKESEYLTDELGEQWSNKIFDYWLEWERENIDLTLAEFIRDGGLSANGIYFAGRSGGHLILGDADYYYSLIEDIEKSLYHHYDKDGKFMLAHHENFREFMEQSDSDYDEIINLSKTLTELDVYNDAVEFIKKSLKQLNVSWTNELYFRIDEYYQGNLLEIKNKCVDENEMRKGGSAKSNREYGKHVEEYNYFVVSDDNVAESGFEFKADADDLTKEFNESEYKGKRWNTCSLKTLKQKGIKDPREDWKKMKNGGNVDNSLFSIFMGKRFAWVSTSDGYYHTWKNRWDKGIVRVWNEGDSETRTALIDSIIQKWDVEDSDVKLEYKDENASIDYLFVKNRFGRDFTDSYVSNWQDRFRKDPEKLINYMDTTSLNTLVTILKFKKDE